MSCIYTINLENRYLIKKKFYIIKCLNTQYIFKFSKIKIKLINKKLKSLINYYKNIDQISKIWDFINKIIRKIISIFFDKILSNKINKNFLKVFVYNFNKKLNTKVANTKFNFNSLKFFQNKI